jgi:hypothetical protein
MIDHKDQAFVDSRSCDRLEVIQNQEYLIGIRREIIQQQGENVSDGRAL